MKEHPLNEPFVARRFPGILWFIIAALSAGLLSLLGSLAGFPLLGTLVMAGSGLLLWADTIRRWRLGLPTMTDLEEWATTTRDHLALRIVREEFTQTDDSQWREQRLQDDSEDRRNLLHFLYVNAPPWTRYERGLEAEDALGDRRVEMLRSRLTREVDPDEAQGEFWRILREAQDRGAKLWPLDLTG